MIIFVNEVMKRRAKLSNYLSNVVLSRYLFEEERAFIDFFELIAFSNKKNKKLS